jgi:hypothetical protein
LRLWLAVKFVTASGVTSKNWSKRFEMMDAWWACLERVIYKPEGEENEASTNSSLLKSDFGLKYLSIIVGYWFMMFSMAVFLKRRSEVFLYPAISETN